MRRTALPISSATRSFRTSSNMSTRNSAISPRLLPRPTLQPPRNQLTADIRNRVADAQKKLAKALAKQIEQSLPTSKFGDQWWIDPIIGLRGQVNFTRWLFLALQGDVGGFGAGSQIAWFASGAIGINITRNVFLETGYRFFYMDYVKNGLTYDAAQSGLFMGVGVKF